MNLHRTGEAPQWETVEPEDRNIFQKVAAKTNGVLTPGNVISVAGAYLVASGLRDIAKGKHTKGIIKVGAGRVLDVGDGIAAEATGTKSPLGEAVDVIIDKGETFIGTPVVVSAGIVPKIEAVPIVAQNAANIVFSGIARRRGVSLHPSKEGKLTMFGGWMVIGLHGLAAAAREHDAEDLANGLEMAAHASSIATTTLGVKAVYGYARDALAPVPAEPLLETAEPIV